MQVQYLAGMILWSDYFSHWLQPVLPQAIILLDFSPSRLKLSSMRSEVCPQAQTCSKSYRWMRLCWKLYWLKDIASIARKAEIQIILIMNYYINQSMKPIHYLQLFFLFLLCSSHSIVQIPIYAMDALELQNTFQYYFCSMCRTDTGPPVCKSNNEYLSKIKETGYFDIQKDPIKKNPYGINIVTVHIAETAQTYKFPNGRLEEKSHSSALFLPRDGGQLRGLVVYLHDSIVGKWNIPSAYGKEFQAIGGLYASQGLATLIPDLPGYRADQDPQLSILYPQIAARSTATTLNEIQTFLKENGAGEELPIFIVGYGQGGNHAAWLTKCISLPAFCPYYTLSTLKDHTLTLSSFYKVKATAAMEGALDLSGVMYNFLTKEVGIQNNYNEFMIQDQWAHNSAKSVFLVSLLESYLFYSLNLTNKLSSYINQDFFEMKCNETIDQSFCNINGVQQNISAVINSNATESMLNFAIAFSSLTKNYTGYRNSFLDADVIAYGGGFKNSALSLASTRLIVNNTFDSALKAASITDFARLVSTPMLVWTLKYDSEIPANNTRNFYELGKKNPFVSFYEFDNNEHQVCEMVNRNQAVDHDRAEILANIFALNFIEKNQ